MKIGIIGPSRNWKDKEIIISKISKIIADTGHEILITADKGSSSEHLAKNFKESNGKKVYQIIPEDDEEFGYDWVNINLGETINCGTWRNQPEKLNEVSDLFICIGYSVGTLAEISYSRWFNPKGIEKKQIYIINELISKKLPDEINERLNINYISWKELKEILES